jgi:lipoprotein Spr
MAHVAAAEIVAAARECLGTRFRIQGRTPGLGLDCVGVGLHAAAAIGIKLPDVRDYTLSGDDQPLLDAVLASAGCLPLAPDDSSPGDFLVFMPRPRQRHLAVRTSAGMIHADIRRRAVLEAPLPSDWLLAGVWRLPFSR